MDIKRRYEINNQQMTEKTAELIDVRRQYYKAMEEGDTDYAEFLDSMINGLENQLMDLEDEYNRITDDSYADDYDYDDEYYDDYYDLQWSDDDNSYI